MKNYSKEVRNNVLVYSATGLPVFPGKTGVMNHDVAMVLSTALTQYIENSSDMELSEQPADLALAQKILDEVDAVLIGDRTSAPTLT